MHWKRVPAYLWALPTTAIGLLFVPLSLIGAGGERRIVDGVLELHGPAIRFLLRHCTLLHGGAAAMTFGHVVIGRDRAELRRTRIHERVHVRQCERWGPLFIPAYLLASLAMLLLGRRPYQDNPFERQAYEPDGRRSPPRR